MGSSGRRFSGILLSGFRAVHLSRAVTGLRSHSVIGSCMINREAGACLSGIVTVPRD